MIQTIRKEVTILQDGRIELSFPELTPGIRAEVIVVIPSPQSVVPKLVSFIGKGKGAFTKSTAADQFLRAERDKWEQKVS